MVLEKINIIPIELMRYIKDYLQFNTLKCTNRNNFNIYFDKKVNKKIIYKKWNTTYFKNVIKCDNYFVFDILLKNNFLFLKKKHCGEYKTQSFPTYLELFNFFCIKYKSQRCRKVLNDILNENGYEKKRVKKIRLKHNRWRN